MNLTTRCPSCGTAFRVQPAQLSARGGRVRCGKCGNIFDGVKALVAEGVEQGEAAPAPDSEPSPQLGLFEVPRKQPGAANEDAPAPDFLDEPPPPKRGLGWALMALLALAALLAHVYFFRAEIAERIPASRPHLLAACELLDCDLPLPRVLSNLSIESTEMRADSERSGVVEFVVQLKNIAPFAQAFPSIVLSLTDSQEEVLSRRVLQTDELSKYVRNVDFTKGIAGNSTMEFRFYFDNNELKAFGYKVALTYKQPT